MIERILRLLTVLEPGDKLVKVKTWRPYFYNYNGKFEFSWPTLLIDRYGYQRCTSSAVWNRTRLRILFGRRAI